VAIQPALILDGVDEYRVTGKRGKKDMKMAPINTLTEAVGPLVPVVFLAHSVLYIVPMLWNTYTLRALLVPYDERIVIIASSAHCLGHAHRTRHLTASRTNGHLSFIFRNDIGQGMGEK